MPIDVAQADEPQAGKSYRFQLVCSIYGEIPYVVAKRVGGVGSLDESISSALVAGIPFILFDNFRGCLDSPLLETCLRGVRRVPVRVPHRGEVQVSVAHINWQLSSNGLEGTTDFAKRALISRNYKRAAGYQVATYPEGDILAFDSSTIRAARNLGAAMARIDAQLRQWPVAGALLLAVAIILAGAMALGPR